MVVLCQFDDYSGGSGGAGSGDGGSGGGGSDAGTGGGGGFHEFTAGAEESRGKEPVSPGRGISRRYRAKPYAPQNPPALI